MDNDKFLYIIIGCFVIVGIAVLSQKFNPKRESTKQSSKAEELRDYIYLSEINDILTQYNIDSKDDLVVSKLREALFNAGEEYVKKELMDIIREETDYLTKVKNLLKKYNDIKTDKNGKAIEFKLNSIHKDNDSKKIYYTAFDKVLKELNKTEEAKKNLREVLPQVFNKIFQRGVDTVLGRIEVNMEFLEKYKDAEKIHSEIKEIQETLDSKRNSPNHYTP